MALDAPKLRIDERQGPDGWANWVCFNEGLQGREGWELALYSDTRFVAHLDEGIGPYMILNAIADPQTTALEPTLVLRVTNHLPDRTPSFELERSEYDAYHGGGLDEEMAALLSMIFGVRLKSGGVVRTFSAGQDPRGLPLEATRTEPYLPPSPRDLIAARLRQGGVDLRSATDLLTMYPAFAAPEAVALVRAARQYQEGAWVAEADPQQAWIRFVGALETAALHWAGPLDPIEALADWSGELHSVLQKLDPVEARRAAEILKGVTGSRRRFGDFVAQFRPEPPVVRPPHEFMRLDWSELDRRVKQVYDWRSVALHTGTPIPRPMCTLPLHLEDGVPEEVTGALAAGQGNAMWMKKDLPMHLHTFAHIARGALLNWWTRGLPVRGNPPMEHEG